MKEFLINQCDVGGASVEGRIVEQDCQCWESYAKPLVFEGYYI